MTVSLSMSSNRAALVANVETRLVRIGVSITPGISIYLSKILRSGIDQSWLKYARQGQFIDDHIMVGALSEMTWKVGTLIATPDVTAHIHAAANLRDADRRSTKINEISNMIRRNFMSSNDITFLVPISLSSHWGICIARVCSGRGTVAWGDGKNWKTIFAPVLSAVTDVMRATFPRIQWSKSSHNYMFHNLNYHFQEDNYSCGLYVISTAATFASNTRSIPAYGYSHGCDSMVTEYIRNAAVVAFFKRVTEYYAHRCSTVPQGPRRGRFTDVDVYRYIYKKKYGYVGRNDDDQLRERSIQWNSTDIASAGVHISNIPQFIARMSRFGIQFQFRRTRILQGSRFESVSDYSCREHRGRCQARLRIYKKRETGSSQFLGVLEGQHNHRPESRPRGRNASRTAGPSSTIARTR